MYGIITYLLNKDTIEEKAFIERLRILRNLIWNSNSGEIRGDADYMKDLLCEVFELITNGTVKKDLRHGFNGFQEDEEIEKMRLMKGMSSEEIERMQMFEDHPLIYGYVTGLGYNFLYLTEAFYTVFNEPNLFDVHRAMISIGDYRQNDNNRFYMGNANRSTWSQLLHKSRNRFCFEEKTMTVLRLLLERVQTGETINAIINEFLLNQENQKSYTWRYYFAKYPDMFRGADGELTWVVNNEYECTTLNRHQFNGQHWNPFLNVIYQRLSNKLKDEYQENIMSLDNYGGNLILLHPIASIKSSNNGYICFVQNSSENWAVQQDNNIDKEDRVLFALNRINDIVRQHLR